MICKDCSKTYQTLGPQLSSEVYSMACAVVLGAALALFSVLYAFIATAWESIALAVIMLVAGAVTIGIGISGIHEEKIAIVLTLRAFVRQSIIGWPIFGYHEHGDVHEHLTAPMGVAYIQVRVGGVFRQCRIVDWAGNILPWTVKCSNGFVGPVTIRHRTTGETLTSSAPARILAKALAVARAEAAKAKRSYEKPTITPVVEPAEQAAA